MNTLHASDRIHEQHSGAPTPPPRKVAKDPRRPHRAREHAALIRRESYSQRQHPVPQRRRWKGQSATASTHFIGDPTRKRRHVHPTKDGADESSQETTRQRTSWRGAPVRRSRSDANPSARASRRKTIDPLAHCRGRHGIRSLSPHRSSRRHDIPVRRTHCTPIDISTTQSAPMAFHARARAFEQRPHGALGPAPRSDGAQDVLTVLEAPHKAYRSAVHLSSKG